MTEKSYHIVVCGSLVPDPLQTLEPIMVNNVPQLKNEMMLPMVLDPWAAHSLYEAANIVKKFPASKIWLVSLGPKAKLQQLMMMVAQKVAFELVAVDGSASGFCDPLETAKILAEAIKGIPNLSLEKLLLFGGWESATRGTGSVLSVIGEILGIKDQFQGVDELVIKEDGSMQVLERVEGGKHLISTCSSAPVMLGWATGYLPEPPNNPQIGMLNMRTIMPALARAKTVNLNESLPAYKDVKLPEQRRDTKVVKNMGAEEVAREILEWIES